MIIFLKDGFLSAILNKIHLPFKYALPTPYKGHTNLGYSHPIRLDA